jgi:hypothetical protein
MHSQSETNINQRKKDNINTNARHHFRSYYGPSTSSTTINIHEKGGVLISAINEPHPRPKIRQNSNVNAM